MNVKRGTCMSPIDPDLTCLVHASKNRLTFKRMALEYIMGQIEIYLANSSVPVSS